MFHFCQKSTFWCSNFKENTTKKNIHVSLYNYILRHFRLCYSLFLNPSGLLLPCLTFRCLSIWLIIISIYYRKQTSKIYKTLYFYCNIRNILTICFYYFSFIMPELYILWKDEKMCVEIISTTILLKVTLLPIIYFFYFL